MKPAEGDALSSLFEPEQCRRWKSNSLRESLVRHLAPPLFEEGSELFVQGGVHPQNDNENAFRIRNVFLDPSFCMSVFVTSLGSPFETPTEMHHAFKVTLITLVLAFRVHETLAQTSSTPPGAIVLDKGWQTPIQGGSSTMEDLGVLLSPFAQPSNDTSQAPKTEINQGTTNLMPYVEAIYQGQ
jgi:hypothetical protein